MSDPLGAAAAAIYTALTAAGPALPPVYQHVPQDTPPPVLIIGDIDLADMGTKDDGDDDCAIKCQLVIVFQGQENKPVTAWQGEIRTRLHRATLLHSGFRIALSVARQRVELQEDGITYAGITDLSGWALAA